MSQPKWECVANLGDINPIVHGGLFVFVDKTGVYAPEAEKLIPDDNDPKTWHAYRFILEPCTFQDGILSDNPYHPGIAAWFAKTLVDICKYIGIQQDKLIGMFLSDDPMERARAWESVGDYHGFDNLDHDPLVLNRAETWGRYNSQIDALVN